MTVYERSIDIAAPPAAVFAVMADVERWHEWTASIRRVHLVGRPLALGSGALIRQPKFPPAWWKVVDLQPDREFSWVSVAPGLRVLARHAALDGPGGGTRALLSLTYTGLFGDWLARVTRDITARYLVMEAEGLKARCEAARR